MAWLSKEKIDSIVSNYKHLEQKMVQSLEPHEYVEVSTQFAELETLVQKIKQLEQAEQELVQLDDMLVDSGEDQDMIDLARDEKNRTLAVIDDLKQAIQLELLPKDAAENKNAILEVRAGTGGNEAALFAGDLFRMYQRYSELAGWKVNIISLSEGEVGGYREVIAEIVGKGAFANLRFESGVHRVQRVPETESSGRVHTSAATVAVLPQADEIDIKIADDELRIDVYRSSGAGGQHVNTTDSAVRITHIPTGMAVAVQDERSQHKNKAKAMKILRARLYDVERTRADDERAATRKAQVGSGDRSERIRTYNFPQGRVTDHRVRLTLYKLDQIMQGEMLDEIIDVLKMEHTTQMLAIATSQ